VSSKAHLKDYNSAFIDFYRSNKISPVRQHLDNLESHFSRRRLLYQYLGIAPNYITGSDIIEFGPGSGHNALYTSSLQPKRYVLVDGNEYGLDDCKLNIKNYFPDSLAHEFIHSRIEEFDSSDEFDLVLCEGVIPHQVNPSLFLEHIAENVKTGGMIVITTADYVSSLSEVLRKMMCVYYVDMNIPAVEQVEPLKAVFSSHLDTLVGMSRFYDDWLYDNMIHKWKNRLFSMADAINTLANTFYVQSSSPKFITDWRWYKDICVGNVGINERAIQQYHENVINFIDFRVQNLKTDQRNSLNIQGYCEDLYWLMVSTTENSNTQSYREAAKYCDHIRDALKEISPITADSLNEASLFFSDPDKNSKIIENNFKSWFGRAQQYMSFVKI